MGSALQPMFDEIVIGNRHHSLWCRDSQPSRQCSCASTSSSSSVEAELATGFVSQPSVDLPETNFPSFLHVLLGKPLLFDPDSRVAPLLEPIVSSAKQATIVADHSCYISIHYLESELSSVGHHLPTLHFL